MLGSGNNGMFKVSNRRGNFLELDKYLLISLFTKLCTILCNGKSHIRSYFSETIAGIERDI